MQLRDYQQECIDTIESMPPGSYLCQMATGLGKTATFTHIPRQGRVLLLSHREELVHQPAKYYDCPVGFERAQERSTGEEVVSASVQTLVQRLEHFSPSEFDMIITDECFPCTVKVDGKPLKNIKHGDIIASWNNDSGKIENKTVLHVFKKKPNKMCVVTLEDGQKIPCTPNHPFYVENSGYIPAIKLLEGFYVRRNVLQGMWKETGQGKLHSEAMEQQTPAMEKRWDVLFKRMLRRVLQKNFERNNVQNKQKVCKRKNEEEQPDEKRGRSEKGFKEIERNRALSKNQMRKRGRAYRSATNTIVSIKRNWALCGIWNTNKICKKVQNAISRRLQSRHSDTIENDCNRSGWKQSFSIGKEGTGFKKRILFEFVRVESVKIQEQTSDGTFGGLCPDGYVYNLEVEGNHNYFADGILVHNCHHASATTYRKIYDYFYPRMHIGFTATPNRGDRVRLDTVFSKIIFQRDLRWGIENGYLCDIHCLRVDIGYDLSRVHTRMGDYAPGELEEAMEGTSDAVAQAYREYAKGATLIFSVSVSQAEEIAQRIHGAVVVTGQTKNRAEIIQRFTDGEIPCIVNVMVFTEGTDIPRVETVIVARPTQSEALYAQMVGRGLRLYPGKEKLTLIDCVGVTGKVSLCTAPSLLGVDMDSVPQSKRNEVQGDLFELPNKIIAASDCPESWIKNVEIVDLWAKEQKYQTHEVNWFKMPDGSLVCGLKDRNAIKIPAPDSLGMVPLKNGGFMPMQDALDLAYSRLQTMYADDAYIWDLRLAKKWGKAPASEKQKQIIAKRCKGFDCADLTKGQASQILNRLFNGGKPS